MKKIKGFTLIEVLVVVAIIGFLSALAVPSMLPKNPWRGSIIGFANTIKLARAKALSTGHPYRIYPADTFRTGSSSVLATGNAEFIVSEGIDGASCNGYTANAAQASTAPYLSGGIRVATNLGRWIPDSRLNFKFPKDFYISQLISTELPGATAYMSNFCIDSNGIVPVISIWINQPNSSIRGAHSLILFNGAVTEPKVYLWDLNWNVIPNGTDGLPTL